MFPQRRIATAVLGVVLVLVGLCIGTLLPPMRYSIWWDAMCAFGGVIAILYGAMAIVRAYAPNLSLTLLRVVRGVLFAAFIGWYLFSFLGSAVQTSNDLGHCQDFADAAVQTNVIPQSVSSPGQPDVFCGIEHYGILQSPYQVIAIYGVPRGQQDKVLIALTTTRHRVNGTAVQVVFYEKENWQIQTAADGSTVIGGSRGPEKIQKVAVIR